MPTTRRRLLRSSKYGEQTLSAAIRVLLSGIDVLSDFPPPCGEATLREIWEEYGDEILAKHTAADPSTRPHGFLWFDAPKLGVPYGKHLRWTDMRLLLTKHGLLSGEALREAREKIEAFKKSGQPMAFWELKNHPPQISL